MSGKEPPRSGVRPPPQAPGALTRTPDAEKYVLEADALRRRQLRSAMLHGTRRTWREHRATWPAVIAGLVVIALIVAAMALLGAARKQGEMNREKEREQQQRSQVTTPPTTVPTPTSTVTVPPPKGTSPTP